MSKLREGSKQRQIRLSIEDQVAIGIIKAEIGLQTDTSAIRYALRQAVKKITDTTK